MDTLADSNDVVDRLGRVLTSAELARIEGLLRDASSSVRNYTHQDFTQATDTVRLAVKGRRDCRNVVRLPQRPVTAVATVVDINANPILFLWEGFDTILVANNLDAFSFYPWIGGLRSVDVTYTHGYETIPDDIIGVVCSITMRALGTNPLDTAKSSESIQGYSYSIGSAGAAGGFGMLSDERAILDAYTLQGGVIRTGP